MKMRRNQSTPASPPEACPSCFYDETFGTAQALAVAGSTTISISPEFSEYFCPQFADVVVMSSADSTINDRALLTDATIKGCSQMDRSSAAGAANSGLVLPDQLSSSAECCLGTPICWGGFGQSGVNNQLDLAVSNLSAANAEDIYVVIRGHASDSLGAWRLGKRCSQR